MELCERRGSLQSSEARVPFGSQAIGVQLAQCLSGTLLTLVCGAAAMIAWRRLALALDRPLAAPWLLLVGVVLVVVARSLRVGRSPFPRRLSALLSVAVLVLGLCLSLPGTHPVALTAFWCLLAGSELWAWRATAWPIGRNRLARPTEEAASADRSEPDASRPAPMASGVAAPSDESVIQQFTRSRAPDGSEQLAGWIRAAFASGQRTANVHVAFCPPLPRTPTLVVEQLDGPAARIKTAQLLPYGARLDLKLATSVEEPVQVLLQVTARSEGGPLAAPEHGGP